MILTMVPETQLYSELRSLEPWPGKKLMEYGEGKKPKGRPRDKAWGMVDLLPNESNRWICRQCKNTYAGGVTRVKQHLTRTGGGGIVPCPGVTPKIQQDALELQQAQAATATARNDGKKQMEYGEGKKRKGRPRDKAWGMVDLLPNESNRWNCRHCKNTYAGNVTRVKRHCKNTYAGGGGIVPCPGVTPKIQQDALELQQAQAATATACNDDRPLLLGLGNIAVAQGGQLDNATFVGPTEAGTGPHNRDAGQNHLVEETCEPELSETDREWVSKVILNEPNE
uniref:BED-type domain-containing protein n=1 Tax=Quercus lobata TaxID=97700 RepID=A0A7N2MWE4_QUELO